MDQKRIKIVGIAITLLAIVRMMLTVLSKETFINMMGWFGTPIITMLSTIMAAWFLIVALSIALIFWDQSTTPLMTIAIVAIIAILLKSIELGWNAIP